jgi:hypothetical protein
VKKSVAEIQLLFLKRIRKGGISGKNIFSFENVRNLLELFHIMQSLSKVFLRNFMESFFDSRKTCEEIFNQTIFRNSYENKYSRHHASHHRGHTRCEHLDVS